MLADIKRSRPGVPGTGVDAPWNSILISGMSDSVFPAHVGARVVPRPPSAFFRKVRENGIRLSRHLLWVRVSQQRQYYFRHASAGGNERLPPYVHARSYLISTSRFGTGQDSGSNCTPLGLHRVAEKIGSGCPTGTVFRSRRPIGFTWQGMPDAKITTRILWLEGLEPGFNRGGSLDSHSRYIYIHGTGDEMTLGRPASCGCIHMATADLIPLFDALNIGTLVWISL